MPLPLKASKILPVTASVATYRDIGGTIPSDTCSSSEAQGSFSRDACPNLVSELTFLASDDIQMSKLTETGMHRR